jgi:putative MATE family efflux protein
MSVKDRSLFSLAWPLVITMAFGISQPMLDSWFLARVSDQAAAAVGSLGALFMTLIMILQALSQAGASIASQYLGGGKRSHARATQILVIAGSGTLGALLGAILWLSSGLLIRLLGLTGQTAVYALQFLQILAIGLVFKALQVTLTNLVASHGRTVWNLSANALSLAINAVLNYAFLEGIFGLPRLGVQGVAYATVISWVGVDLLLWLVLKHNSGSHKTFTNLKRGVSLILPDWMRIGLPSAVEPVSFSLYQIAISAVVIRLGETSMAAKVYGGNFAMLAIVFSVGIGIGSQILVAHLVGAQDYGKANQRLIQSLFWACGFAFSVALLVAFFATQLLSIYTENTAVIALAAACLWVDAILQPAKAANIVLTNALRAAGDSKFPAIVGTSMMWTIGIGGVFAFVYGFQMGLLGAWIAMAVDEWTRSFVNYRRWTSGAWHGKGVMREKITPA